MTSYRQGPLTAENLTETSPEWEHFSTADLAGMRPMDSQDIAVMVLGTGPQGLPPLVDEFLLRARECMAYGGFHYPLMTVGLGQLGLAAEAAIRAYATAQGLPVKNPKGNTRGMRLLIHDLSAGGYLTPEQVGRWATLTALRNHLFHPEYCPVYSPGMALDYLTGLTDALLDLFPEAHFAERDLTNPPQN